jgi:hypothetical protein
MKKGLSEIVLILDESGSMNSSKSDTIGGVNGFLKSQQKIRGEASITLVKFSDYYKIVNDAAPLDDVVFLDESNYIPSNTTALFDAVGKTIDNIGKRLAETPEGSRPEKVIFAIITDGLENASSMFSQKQIFSMVTHQKEKYNWDFIFLGADIDTWGEEIGITNNVQISKNDLPRALKSLSYFTANERIGGLKKSLTNIFDMSDDQLDQKLGEMEK